MTLHSVSPCCGRMLSMYCAYLLCSAITCCGSRSKPEGHRGDDAAFGAKPREQRRRRLGAQARGVEIELPVDDVLQADRDDGLAAREAIVGGKILRGDVRSIVGHALLGGEAHVLRHEVLGGLAKKTTQKKKKEAERQ